jgi:hypothetical protein
MHSQTMLQNRITENINLFCKGSWTNNGKEKQTVIASFIGKDSLKIIKNTYSVDSNNLVRTNTFTFKLSDLDLENTTIINSKRDPTKTLFGINLNCSYQLKKIKQEYNSKYGNYKKSYETKFYLGDFEDKVILEQIKKDFIQLIK